MFAEVMIGSGLGPALRPPRPEARRDGRAPRPSGSTAGDSNGSGDGLKITGSEAPAATARGRQRQSPDAST